MYTYLPGAGGGWRRGSGVWGEGGYTYVHYLQIRSGYECAVALAGMGEEDPAAEEDEAPWFTKPSTPDWEFCIAISLSTSVVCFQRKKKKEER